MTLYYIVEENATVMGPALRWFFVLLPCLPGLTLLLAAAVLEVFGQQEPDAAHLQPLLVAGGAVLLAGLAIGAIVAWRIAHPRPEPEEEDE